MNSELGNKNGNLQILYENNETPKKQLEIPTLLCENLQSSSSVSTEDTSDSKQNFSPCSNFQEANFLVNS